jgi:hypothetical protein
VHPVRVLTRSSTVFLGALVVVLLTAATVAAASISADQDLRGRRVSATANGALGSAGFDAVPVAEGAPAPAATSPVASAPSPDTTRPITTPRTDVAPTPTAPGDLRPGTSPEVQSPTPQTAEGPDLQAGVSYHVHLFDWSYPSVWAEANDDDAHITRLVVNWGDGAAVTVAGDPSPCREGPDGSAGPSTARIPLEPPLSHQYGAAADYRATVTAYSSPCDGSDERSTTVAPTMAPYPWPPAPPPPGPPPSGPPTPS